MSFAKLKLPKILGELLIPSHLSDYPRSSPDRLIEEQLQNLVLADLATDPSVKTHPDSMMHGRCCQAGLWLLFGFLDESHTISQSIDTPAGSWWHAIMHRLEGDYSNAKYWYRRVGRHEVEQKITDRLQAIHGPSSSWNPNEFVDQCRTNAGSRTPNTKLNQIAQIEWQELFAYNYDRTMSSI